MKYVKEVESNIKTHTGATALGPKTLILAGNREGKSAIVNAIELALTGTASDVVGRALVKEVNRLLSLSREDSLFAKVQVADTTGGDDKEVEWRTKGKKGSFVAQPPGLYNPVSVFPLRTVREALAGGVETTRKFFIGFVAGGVTDDDVFAEIPKPYHKAFEEVTTAIPRTAPVDLLLAGLARAKERLTAVRSEIATRKDVVKEAGAGLPPMPSDKDYLAVQERVADLDVQLAFLHREAGAAASVERTQAEFARLKGRLEEIEQAVDGKTIELARAQENWPEKPGDLDTLRPHHLAVLRFSKEKNLKKCPTCQKPVGSIDSLPTDENRAAFWGQRVATVEAAATARAGVNAAFEAHADLVNDIEVTLRALGDERDQVLAQKEALGVIPDATGTDASLDEKISDLRAELDLARTQITDMEKTRASWAPVLKARDMAAVKEGEVDKWGRLIDALKAAIGNLLDKGCNAFVARVQAHLPEGDTFALRLRDEDREVCQYGLMRDGKLHEALSGVEWAYVTAAIAAAAIPDNEKHLLHVVVFEDRAWDAQTLRAVCLATSSLDAQVIIATTPPEGWAGDDLEGWTILRPHATAGAGTPVVKKADAALTEAIEEPAKQAAPEKPTTDAVPKFIQDYIAKNPQATYTDLMREFKISLNRATAILPPPKRGRKPKEKKPEEPKPELAPYLE